MIYLPLVEPLRANDLILFNSACIYSILSLTLSISTEEYTDVLDASRVHPETYEWARKMAIDALEIDDTAEDANPAAALEVPVSKCHTPIPGQSFSLFTLLYRHGTSHMLHPIRHDIRTERPLLVSIRYSMSRLHLWQRSPFRAYDSSA